VDLGMAADLGSIGKLPLLCNNKSTAAELLFTGRNFNAAEAHQLGFLSQIFDDYDQMETHALQLAHVIASKSSVAIYGIKTNLVYSQNHANHSETLERLKIWNSAMLQSFHFQESMQAAVEKRKPQFAQSKL
jgi:delta(3,5)-delta(2,4)-dienoyl-CoA isomerase